jgi:hypothetical protein
VGWLLGDVHAGIVQMFQVIAHTRLSVATKALATLSTGYLNTLDFARIRVQGNDIADTGNPGSQRVAIVEHPEVRKTLMLAKCYSEGLRALLVYTAGLQDAVVAAEPASEAQAHVQARLQLLLPVVKGACSERAYEHLGQLLEVFGGSGYLRDYPLEQYVRDTRIDAIYEGTTAIQGQDLFLRRIARDGGQTFGDLCDEIESFLPELTEPELLDPAAALRVAVADIRAIVAEMVRRHDAGRAGRPREARRAGQTTTLLLLTAADLLVGYLLASQASLSLRALAAGGPSAADTAFYQGKVAAARYFARTVLPEFAGRRRVVDATGTELMALDPDVL